MQKNLVEKTKKFARNRFREKVVPVRNPTIER